MDISRQELWQLIYELQPGTHVALHHTTYAKFFPPGEPDQAARRAAQIFAKSAGCRIENKPKIETIWFLKEGGGARV